VSLNKISWKLPPALSAAIDSSFADWKNNNKVARLWKKDASLWTGTDESNWLGWLTITEQQMANLATFKKLAQEVKKAIGFSAICCCSAWAVRACARKCSRLTYREAFLAFPELHILDSTDPGTDQSAREESWISRKTLCIVSSKSGSTLEPNIFKQYFLRAHAADKVGP
jgi:transaldolase / glucose-6-phosphate isomerase